MSEEILEFLNDEKAFSECVKKVFESVDTDNSGLIDPDEFVYCITGVFQEMGESPPSREEAIKLLNTLDTDNDGVLDQKEFGVLVKKLLETVLLN